MKYSLVALVFAAVASAQSINEIPACARTCLEDAVKKDTTCSETDFACICKDIDTIQGTATSCVISACGESVAINQVLPAAQKLCEQVAAGSGSSSAAASTTAAASSSAAVSSSAAGGYTSAAATTSAAGYTTAPATTAAPTTMAVSTSAAAGNGTATVPVTAGAAAFGPVGGLALLALGALAL